MSEETTVLDIAKDMGYNPDFDGEGKKTAEEFIMHGANIQRKQSTKIKDLIGKVEGMSSEFANVQKTFAETIDSQKERHNAELKRERAKLETKLDTAVDEADTGKVKELRKEIENLEKPAKAETKPIPGQEYFNKMIEKNEWINTDKKAQAEFNKALIDCKMEHGQTSADFEVKYAEKKLKEIMPEKFGLKPKESPPAGGVGEGKSVTKVSKELKVSDLNSEEKAQYNRTKKIFGKNFNEKSTLSAFKAVRDSKGAK